MATARGTGTDRRRADSAAHAGIVGRGADRRRDARLCPSLACGHRLQRFRSQPTIWTATVQVRAEADGLLLLRAMLGFRDGCPCERCRWRVCDAAHWRRNRELPH